MRENIKLIRCLDSFDHIFYFLALLMVPMLIIEYSITLSVLLQNIFHDYFLFLWGLFLLEFLLRFFLSSAKRKYLIGNWVEIVVIFFPFLRIFRVIEISEIGFILFIETLSKKFPTFHLRAFLKTFIIAFIILAITSELILFLEKPYYASTHIKTFADALWWSTVGISTIGVGNVVPQSPGGKILTIFLMISGIVFFSILTANISSLFTEKDVKKDIDKELKTIEKDLSTEDKNIKAEVVEEDKNLETILTGIEKRITRLEKHSK